MNTQDVAERYVTLCKEGRFDAALELFSESAVSVEAAGPEARGLAAIREKGKAWGEAHEVHAVTVTGPWPNGDRFVVVFALDLTNKPAKQRIQMTEAGLFTVEAGKIVREEFFYAT